MSHGRGVLRLFLLPCAGGSAALYRGWDRRLGPEVEPTAIELPGRGRRLREPLLSSVPELVDDLERRWRPEPPWAVAGHSMGALLAAAWAARTQAAGRGPELAVLSGAAPPWLGTAARFFAADGGDLWQRLDVLGGLPPLLRDHPQARGLFGRVVEADLAAVAAYRTGPSELRLSCPLVVAHGADDPLVPPSVAAQWQRVAASSFTHRVLPGGHFYTDGVQALLPLLPRAAVQPRP